MVVGLLLAGVFSGPAARLYRAARLHRAARGGRPRDRDLRPGRARLPDRRDAAGASRRGVRAVWRGPDGRPAARARRSGRSGRTALGGIGFVFVFSGVAAAARGDPDRPARARERTEDASGPAAGLRRSSRPIRRRSRGRAAAAVAADRGSAADRGRPEPAPEPGLDRGAGHQCRRQLRGRHLRRDLEPVPAGARGRAGPDRAHVCDVRLADPGALADGRPARRSPRVVRLHRPRARSCRRSSDSSTRASRTRSWRSRSSSIEATGFAFLNPALYSVVAANSPPGRSSTAQGLFGAAGTPGSSWRHSSQGSWPLRTSCIRSTCSAAC